MGIRDSWTFKFYMSLFNPLGIDQFIQGNWVGGLIRIGTTCGLGALGSLWGRSFPPGGLVLMVLAGLFYGAWIIIALMDDGPSFWGKLLRVIGIPILVVVIWTCTVGAIEEYREESRAAAEQTAEE